MSAHSKINKALTNKALTIFRNPQIVEAAIHRVIEHRLNQERLRQHAALSKAHQALKEEIKFGERIYEKMLAGALPPPIPTLDIAAISLPSQELDGDFYEFFHISPLHLDLSIGDVMGKGIPAALIATSVKSGLARIAKPLNRVQHHQSGVWSDDLCQPREVLEYLHRTMIDQLTYIEYFASIFYGRFDLNKRTFTYIDCGFTKPFHFKNGSLAHLKTTRTPPLGMVEEMGYHQSTVNYQPGDLFVFYSDGITESRNASNELFGVERLSCLIQANEHLTPDELIACIKQEVAHFTETEHFHDDFTLVIIRVTDEPPPQQHVPQVAKFQSDLSQLEAVRDFVYRVCQCLPGNPETITLEMQLAINEIFCNIVKHGSENGACGNIVIQAELGGNKVLFDIADQGPSYDPGLINEPSLAGDQDGGFGWYMIKKIADKVTYTHKKSADGWNHLALEKKYGTRDTTMEISHTYEQDVLVITPEITVLDAKEVPDFKETLMNIIDNKNPTGANNVILNLKNIDFIDSSGLGSFLSIMRSLRANGGQLKLVNMKKPVRTIFDLVSMSKAFEIYETLEEGLKSFS